MFINYIGILGSIVTGGKDEYVIWELITESCISDELYKGNTTFYELITIYCVE